MLVGGALVHVGGCCVLKLLRLFHHFPYFFFNRIHSFLFFCSHVSLIANSIQFDSIQILDFLNSISDSDGTVIQILSLSSFAPSFLYFLLHSSSPLFQFIYLFIYFISYYLKMVAVESLLLLFFFFFSQLEEKNPLTILFYFIYFSLIFSLQTQPHVQMSFHLLSFLTARPNPTKSKPKPNPKQSSSLFSILAQCQQYTQPVLYYDLALVGAI